MSNVRGYKGLISIAIIVPVYAAALHYIPLLLISTGIHDNLLHA